MKNKLTIKLLLLGAMNFVALVLFFMSPHLIFAQAIPLPDPLRPQTSSNMLPQYNQGVDLSIKDYLCTPEGNGTDLFNCVNRLTKFAISAGSIVLVFLIVLAGYMYIAGGEAQKGKAKGIVFSSLTGMVIILVSFTLLNFINPALVQIKPIQPPIFSSANLPKCEDIGFSSNCIISTGDAKGQVYTAGSGGPGIGKCETVQGNGVSCKAGCVKNEQVKCEKKYDSYIAKAVQQYGLEDPFIRATIQIESGWSPNRTSPAGAKGLMQMMPAAIKDAGCAGKDIFDPETNILCGTHYWSIIKDRYLKQYGSSVQNSIRALGSAYNEGWPSWKFSKAICGDRYGFECPFTDATKKTCKALTPENVNYGVTLEEFYNQYKSGKCK